MKHSPLLLFLLTACGERVPCPANTTDIKDGAPPNHMAVFDLVSADAASHTAVASGGWSDPATWGGAVPGEGADVFIPEGLTVTVDGELAPSIETIGIAGALDFATSVDTALRVDTLVSLASGSLQIGSADDPIQPDVTAQITFTDSGPLDLDRDPAQIGRGAVLHGQTTIHGAEKTAWLALADHPRAGDDALTLSQAPVGWRPGDELAIAAIDGHVITLDAPLALDHVAPADDLDVHAANLTRNVAFTSASAEIDRRGHVMFMHTLDVDVSYAAFRQLGRTDKRQHVDDFVYPDLDGGPVCVGPGTNVRGRYSVHFHQGGSDPSTAPALMLGSVVVDDPGWAFVNHSSNVDFISNVSYDVVGGAYQTEAGDEIGSFIGNIALRTINPDYPLTSGTEQALVDIREEYQDYSFQGDGFWLHGGGPRVEGNVVAGASGHAYIYWTEGLIEPDGQMMTVPSSTVPDGDLLVDHQEIDVWWIPVASFRDNVGYAAPKGLEFYYLHALFLAEEEDPLPSSYMRRLHSTFEDLTLWGMSQHGIGLNFTTNVTFRNVRLVADPALGPETKGIDADQFFNTEDLCFEDLTVEGFGVGVDVPTQGRILFDGGSFENRVDLRIGNPQIGPREMTLRDLRFPESDVYADGERAPIQMNPDFTLHAEIQDGLDDEDEGKHPLFFLMPDRIALEGVALFDETIDGEGLYFDEQRADFVPMVETESELEGTDVAVDRDYVDLTNRELQDEHEMSFGGALLPSAAASVAGIEGGQVGPTAPEPVSFPEMDDW